MAEESDHRKIIRNLSWVGSDNIEFIMQMGLNDLVTGTDLTTIFQSLIIDGMYLYREFMEEHGVDVSKLEMEAIQEKLNISKN